MCGIGRMKNSYRDETPLEAILSEIYEETGYHVNALDRFTCYL